MARQVGHADNVGVGSLAVRGKWHKPPWNIFKLNIDACVFGSSTSKLSYFVNIGNIIYIDYS